MRRKMKKTAGYLVVSKILCIFAPSKREGDPRRLKIEKLKIENWATREAGLTFEI